MDFWGSWKLIDFGKSIGACSLDCFGESLREAASFRIGGLAESLHEQMFPVFQPSCFESMSVVFNGVSPLTDQLADIKTYSDCADNFTWQAAPIELTPPEPIISSWIPCKSIFTEPCRESVWPIAEALSFNFEPITFTSFPGFGKTTNPAENCPMVDFSAWTELFKHRKLLNYRRLYFLRRLLFRGWRYWYRPATRDDYKSKHFSLGEKKRHTRKLAPSARAGWVPGAVSKVKHGFAAQPPKKTTPRFPSELMARSRDRPSWTWYSIEAAV